MFPVDAMDDLKEKICEGFPDQRLAVISRKLMKRRSRLPVAHHVHFTHIVQFSRTGHHYVSRTNGIDQYIVIFSAPGRSAVSLHGNRREMAAGLSVPHYTALFRKQAGISPVRYLTRVRLRHACELLDCTEMHVSEGARAVGYEDAFYFFRLFRKYNGHAPTDYRKLNVKSHRTVPGKPE